MRSAASRDSARNPLAASGTVAPEMRLMVQLPTACSHLLMGEKCCKLLGFRSPTTTSLLPSSTGWIKRGISFGSYWPSASRFTTMSAPILSAASNPVR